MNIWIYFLSSYFNSSRNLHSRIGAAVLLQLEREDVRMRSNRVFFKCNSHKKRISSELLTVPRSVQTVRSSIARIVKLNCWKWKTKLVRSVPGMQSAVIMTTEAESTFVQCPSVFLRCRLTREHAVCLLNENKCENSLRHLLAVNDEI